MARPSYVSLRRGRPNYTGSGALDAIGESILSLFRYFALANHSRSSPFFNLFLRRIQRRPTAHVAHPVAGPRMDALAARRAVRPIQIGRNHPRSHAAVHPRPLGQSFGGYFAMGKTDDDDPKS